MFKRERVHQRVSDGARIFDCIFCKLLLVDCLAFDLIEAWREPRLQNKVDPQTPTLARRCKDVEIKSETVPKVFVTVEGVTSVLGNNLGTNIGP